MEIKNKIKSEDEIEKDFIELLKSYDYTRIILHDEKDLHYNLKKKLERLNKIKLTEQEFRSILLSVKKNTIFENSKVIRDRVILKGDNDPKFIRFFDFDNYDNNVFQIANQISDHGLYDTRYDVTILINGLPIIQIELKRKDVELSKAFDQISRYKTTAYTGLFNYIQLFIISNYNDTKYFANNDGVLPKSHIFNWADIKNQTYHNLDDFSKIFFDKNFLMEFIDKYIVFNTTGKCLMALRSYQYYAVRAIMDKVQTSIENGYIWHTTGSGKTLTSFKTSQLLVGTPGIDQVIFVVDRNDLDKQTQDEFEAFDKDAVTSTDNTKSLVKQLKHSGSPLIITTIQKLTNAVKKKHHNRHLDKIKAKRVVLIFDECHRSQFGEMHKVITEYFTNTQSIGFTGTPILVENCNKNKTTADVFGECLHKYLINDAIADRNVLGFNIFYHKTIRDKNTASSRKVEGINTSEAFRNSERISNIVDFIIDSHNDITDRRKYNAILAVDYSKTLHVYYDMFKQKDHNLKIATIFTWEQNEEITDKNDKLSRLKLEDYIRDFNEMFGTNESTKDFNRYRRKVDENVKNGDIDILLVVDMFLTGFNSPFTNTLYLDKNLQYHTLVQAYSRTNRVLDGKSHGNIISFRDLKKNTDKAIALYSNPDSNEHVVMEPYKEVLQLFNTKIMDFLRLYPDIESVLNFRSEELKAEFIKDFRNLIIIRNRLKTYVGYNIEELNIDEDLYASFLGIYKSMYNDISRRKEKVSIIDDLDFHIELLANDKINVDYILTLLIKYKNKDPEERELKLINSINTSNILQSKQKLIKEFIVRIYPSIENKSDEEIKRAYQDFVYKEKDKEYAKIAEVAKMNHDSLHQLEEEFKTTGKIDRDLLEESLNDNVPFLERFKILEETEEKLLESFNKFNKED